MSQKTNNFSFDKKRDLLGKVAMAAFLLAAFVVPAYSQDNDDAEFGGKVLDAGNRQIGKADFIQDTGDVKTNFGYSIKMWLDDGRLRIIRPSSGSRSSTINCSFREYKVDSKNPKDDRLWDETGSGTASLQMPPTGEVRKITGSMVMTKKVVGDEDVAVNEKPQKFVIVID